MRRILCLMLLQLVAWPCVAAPGLPAYLTLPPAVQLPHSDSLTVEAFGEGQFSLPGTDDPVIQRGQHWSAHLRISGLPEDSEQQAIWARVKPALRTGGWTTLLESDVHPYSVTLRYQKKSKDVWGTLRIFGTDDLRLDLIEITAQRITLRLTSPAATPENVSAESGDFPYLAPLPGSTPLSSAREDMPMLIDPLGSAEPLAVGSGSIRKHYQGPDGLSNVQFITVYREALQQAGWREVRSTLPQGRIARVIFCLHNQHAVLLHGFIKKTPKSDMDVARRRKREVER